MDTPGSETTKWYEWVQNNLPIIGPIVTAILTWRLASRRISRAERKDDIDASEELQKVAIEAVRSSQEHDSERFKDDRGRIRELEDALLLCLNSRLTDAAMIGALRAEIAAIKERLDG